MKLSTLAIGLGILGSIPQLYGLWKPGAFAAAVRKFPRSENWGYVLMAIGTAWFLWNLNNETISDFAAYKKIMLLGFGAVGVLSCIYVKDYLAVRGLSVVLLLAAKLVLDTARWNNSPWRLVLAVGAYFWIVCAMWFMVSPWRFRDLVVWSTANEKRIRVTSAIRLAGCILILALGLTTF